MRASQPIRDGYVERDGVKIFYEVFGSGEPTVLLLPTWSIIHSRQWKMQIPYLSRHCRVITFDGRGNGRSDRPTDAEAYAETEFAADAIAVHGRDADSARDHRRLLDGRTARPASCREPSGAGSRRPSSSARATRAAGSPCPHGRCYEWEDELDTDEGWAKYNRQYWLRDYRGFLEFFFSQDASPSRIRRSRSKTASAGASRRLARRSR